MPNKGTAKRRAPKGVLGRLIRTLFGFYPVLLPVTVACILDVYKRQAHYGVRDGFPVQHAAGAERYLCAVPLPQHGLQYLQDVYKRQGIGH